MEELAEAPRFTTRLLTERTGTAPSTTPSAPPLPPTDATPTDPAPDERAR